MQNRPTVAEVKSSYQLWVQWIDGNTRTSEFNSMTEEKKDSWLKIFGWL